MGSLMKPDDMVTGMTGSEIEDQTEGHVNDQMGGLGGQSFSKNAAAILETLNHNSSRREKRRSSDVEDQVREVDSFCVY